MMTPGKLELTIKINALPTDATTAPNGSKTFGLDCGGRTVTMTLRPKMFAKLEIAARDWSMWVAAISGQMGPATPEGFELLEPNVQTFEKKPKASAAPTEVK
jgi:hypothetical protein